MDRTPTPTLSPWDPQGRGRTYSRVKNSSRRQSRQLFLVPQRRGSGRRSLGCDQRQMGRVQIADLILAAAGHKGIIAGIAVWSCSSPWNRCAPLPLWVPWGESWVGVRSIVRPNPTRRYAPTSPSGRGEDKAPLRLEAAYSSPCIFGMSWVGRSAEPACLSRTGRRDRWRRRLHFSRLRLKPPPIAAPVPRRPRVLPPVRRPRVWLPVRQRPAWPRRAGSPSAPAPSGSRHCGIDFGGRGAPLTWVGGSGPGGP